MYITNVTQQSTYILRFFLGVCLIFRRHGLLHVSHLGATHSITRRRRATSSGARFMLPFFSIAVFILSKKFWFAIFLRTRLPAIHKSFHQKSGFRNEQAELTSYPHYRSLPQGCGRNRSFQGDLIQLSRRYVTQSWHRVCGWFGDTESGAVCTKHIYAALRGVVQYHGLYRLAP